MSEETNPKLILCIDSLKLHRRVCPSLSTYTISRHGRREVQNYEEAVREWERPAKRVTLCRLCKP